MKSETNEPTYTVSAAWILQIAKSLLEREQPQFTPDLVKARIVPSHDDITVEVPGRFRIKPFDPMEIMKDDDTEPRTYTVYLWSNLTSILNMSLL